MSGWINLLASLLDWMLVLIVDVLSGQYEHESRAVDVREVERTQQTAKLEAARAASQAEAERQHAEAERLARARAAVTYGEGASPEDIAEAINRELH